MKFSDFADAHKLGIAISYLANTHASVPAVAATMDDILAALTGGQPMSNPDDDDDDDDDDDGPDTPIFVPVEGAVQPLIWKNRAVKIEDGCFMLSSEGDHDDFDVAAEHKAAAFAGNVGYGRVISVRIIDDDNLLIECTDSNYVMTMDSSGAWLIKPLPSSMTRMVSIEIPQKRF